MAPPTLLAVPNVSEGRDRELVARIAAAFAGETRNGEPRGGHSDVRLLDIHTDRDHHRTVYTLAGAPGELAEALVRGARVAVELIDVVSRSHGPPQEIGQHPHVGALDVAPIVYLRTEDRGAACAEALVLADRLGEELALPVFLYGELSGGDAVSARTRAELRRGGLAGLAARMVQSPPLAPDFGPPAMHASAGAALVAARAPLVAFNLVLAAPASLEDARAVAARVREGGEEGLAGLRAIGVTLGDGRAQVSMNVERPFELSLAHVVQAVRAHARVESAELVGLAPAAALTDFPQELPMPGFDPSRHVIENALGSQ